MKPLHVGLLVVGAAFAGALAVKMTQPSAYTPLSRGIHFFQPRAVASMGSRATGGDNSRPFA